MDFNSKKEETPYAFYQKRENVTDAHLKSKIASSKNSVPGEEESNTELLKSFFFVFFSQAYKSEELICDESVPSSQDFDSSSRTQTFLSDKSISSSKLDSTSLDETLFEDLPTSREPPSNIKSMSEEIRVQGLTALSVEPPRWETPPIAFFTNKPNVLISGYDN